MAIEKFNERKPKCKMTEKVNGILIIKGEEPQQCDTCGKVAELRPYGKDGACICFSCAEKIPEVVEQQFNKLYK